MPAATQPLTGVNEVLRARANARRIKEHYDGTLGVPSELQTLSHLLAHDKDGVFAGLEKLPDYNKSDYPPPPSLEPTRHNAPDRRYSYGASQPFAPTIVPSRYHSVRRAASRPPSNWPPQLHVYGSNRNISSASTQSPDFFNGSMLSDPQQPSPGLLPHALQPDPHAAPASSFHPPEAGAGHPSDGSLSPPSLPPPLDVALDPKRWERYQVNAAAATTGPPSPPPSSQHPSAKSLVLQGAGEGDGAGAAGGGFGSSMDPFPVLLSPAFPSRPNGHSASGSSTVTGSGTDSWYSSYGDLSTAGPLDERVGLVELNETSAEEAVEGNKLRMVRQGLLSPDELTPQEWARIGPSQDALEKFTARQYLMSVDYDRQTLAPKRVARPDIFHIAPEEAQRRELEAHEATQAMQALRRAEEEAKALAAEAEWRAREAARGPQYDAMGVLQPADRTTASPVRPRYLDWHPEGVGGLQATQSRRAPYNVNQRSISGGSGYGSGGSGSPPIASSGPSGPWAAAASVSCSGGASGCASASHRVSEYPAMYGGGGGGGGRTAGTCTEQQAAGGRRTTDTAMQGDSYVYEDFGEETAMDQVAPAYDSRPPQRRYHSAIAGNNVFSRPPRPPGVSDAHYAQILRQQRKWLNGPAQPPRPSSAVPPPPPLSRQYLRPRSSRPPPLGTAAPIPTRMSASSESVFTPMAAPDRTTDADLRIALQHCGLTPSLTPRTRVPWEQPSARPHSAADSVEHSTHSVTREISSGGGGGGVRDNTVQCPPSATSSSATAAPPPDTAATASATSTPRGGKRLPWEAREHAAAAAAASIIPPRRAMSTSANGSRGPPGARLSSGSLGGLAAAAAGGL